MVQPTKPMTASADKATVMAIRGVKVRLRVTFGPYPPPENPATGQQ